MNSITSTFAIADYQTYQSTAPLSILYLDLFTDASYEPNSRK